MTLEATGIRSARRAPGPGRRLAGVAAGLRSRAPASLPEPPGPRALRLHPDGRLRHQRRRRHSQGRRSDVLSPGTEAAIGKMGPSRSHALLLLLLLACPGSRASQVGAPPAPPVPLAAPEDLPWSHYTRGLVGGGGWELEGFPGRGGARDRRSGPRCRAPGAWEGPGLRPPSSSQSGDRAPRERRGWEESPGVQEPCVSARPPRELLPPGWDGDSPTLHSNTSASAWGVTPAAAAVEPAQGPAVCGSGEGPLRGLGSGLCAFPRKGRLLPGCPLPAVCVWWVLPGLIYLTGSTFI